MLHSNQETTFFFQQMPQLTRNNGKLNYIPEAEASL
jgi:hypothetical protein